MEEQVFEFQAKIDRYEEQVEKERDRWRKIRDEIPELEIKVAQSVIQYVSENPAEKKVAREKQERDAAITPEQKVAYFRLMAMRIERDMTKLVIDSLHNSISAVQSEMSWWKATNFQGMK
jgi:hypothetical protein